MINEILKICEEWYLLMYKLIKAARNIAFDGCFLQNVYKT